MLCYFYLETFKSISPVVLNQVLIYHSLHPKGLTGNVWGHFCLSQVGWGVVCYWQLVSRGQR